MDLHQNARLTVACRVLLLGEDLAGRPKVQAAGELSVGRHRRQMTAAQSPGRDGRS
jgi:hypothetical protein